MRGTRRQLGPLITAGHVAVAACLAACPDPGSTTSVKLTVAYEESWGLDQLEVKARGKAFDVDVAHELELRFPEDWAGERVLVEVEGYRERVTVTRGEVTVTPRLGEQVRAAVTLALLREPGLDAGSGDVSMADGSTADAGLPDAVTSDAARPDTAARDAACGVCALGEVCQDGVCRLDGLAPGQACIAREECAGGDRAWCSTEFPGGYCFITGCGGNPRPCPEGSFCLVGSGGSACVEGPCGEDADCSRHEGEGFICDEDQACWWYPPCEGETDAELCAIAGRSCGALGATDRCGAERQVSCGSCEAIGLAFVSIPGGSFELGCSEGDADCVSVEEPRHEVSVAAFALLETEVTQAQYLAVTGEAPSHFSEEGGGVACGDSCPVEMVGWQDAKDFCAAVGGRLPSEAEWEYAARAGTTARFTCGDDATCLDAVAWRESNANYRTHPVRAKAPNSLGLYDMTGNVAEWVEDCWHTSYEGAPATGGPWTGGDCRYRGLRGGSWNSQELHLRVSYRESTSVSSTSMYFGLRCAR